MKHCPVIDIQETGKNIKRIMKEKGFNVQDIQEYLGLGTPQCVYHWFKGRNMPSIDNLYGLSALFQMPVDAMLIGNRIEESNCREVPFDRRVIFYYERIRKSIIEIKKVKYGFIQQLQ